MADSRDSLRKLHELFLLREQAAADQAALARRAHERAQREAGATRAAIAKERSRLHTLVDSRASCVPADLQGHRLGESLARAEVARAEARAEQARGHASTALEARRAAEKVQVMEAARSRALGRLHGRRQVRPAEPEASDDG